MKFLFPSSTIDSSIPDSCFENEFKIASDLVDCYLLDTFELHSGDCEKAIRRLPSYSNEEIFLYRGWMLSTERYNLLQMALKEKNVILLNDHMAYGACHHMYCYYDLIKYFTPKSIFCRKDENIESMFDMCVKSFEDNSSLFIKDSVSSQKYLWKSASFIEDFKKSFDIFSNIVSNFIKYQNQYRGNCQDYLVFRQFIPLKNLGYHKTGGMPFSQEFRSFVYNGDIISTHKYWEGISYGPEHPDKQWLKDIAYIIYEKTKNNFFTLDSALTLNNKWIVIEIGDGQVSSIQDENETYKIYSSIVG